MDETNTNDTPTTDIVDKLVHAAREQELLLALIAIRSGTDAKTYLENRLVTVKMEKV